MIEEQRVKDLQRALEKERQIHKPSIHEKMVKDAEEWLKSYDFWCDDCEEDFTTKAYKTTHRLYGDVISVYRAEHEDCGELCIRLITHRDQDPYYQRSDKIKKQRNQYRIEVLQHEEFGFDLYYRNPFKDYEDKLKAKEERKFIKKREKGFSL